jgi:hypothetical protein
VLSAFDSPLETTRWHIVGCDVRPGNGWDVTIRNDTNCAALVLGDVPRDWTTAEGLGVDIFLHGEEPSDLTIIVDDTAFFPDYNNRFQKTTAAETGVQRRADRRRIPAPDQRGPTHEHELHLRRGPVF